MHVFFAYLNPISRFGTRRYSFLFPLAVSLLCVFLTELYVHFIAGDPNAVGLLAIFIFIALIIYFAFHDGIKGGLVTVTVTISYYIFIIYSRQYTGEQLTSGLRTTGVLGIVYILLAVLIGWLRQTIDGLIEKEANEKIRFQTIMQQLPVGVIVTDKFGTIEFANKQADIILGTKVPIGFTVGQKSLAKISDSKPTSLSLSLLAKALSTGKAYINEEFTVTKNDKKITFIEGSASPIRNVNGVIIAAAEILTDVTNQKELEQRKDDFINMASHELKTPLTSMKLYLHALNRYLRSISEPNARKVLENITIQTNRLQDLVGDLLDMSRLQTGKLSFEKEIFRLDKLIEETITDLQPGITANKIVYTRTFAATVYADKLRIYQVLTNLITNAAKYSSADKKIVIKLQEKDGSAIVSVQDHGIGIDKDHQKKIFDRLYQVNEPREKTYPGLGIGLYISAQIIKRHKGKIWVESEKSKGSIFYFSLPLKKK